MEGLGEGTVRMLTVNCNSLRKRKQILALGHLLANVKARECVATESHLRRKDPEEVAIRGFEAVAIPTPPCRKAEGVPMTGGVSILATTKLTMGTVRNGDRGGKS